LDVPPEQLNEAASANLAAQGQAQRLYPLFASESTFPKPILDIFDPRDGFRRTDNAAGPDRLFNLWTDGPKLRLSQENLAEFAKIVEAGRIARRTPRALATRRPQARHRGQIRRRFSQRYVGTLLKKLKFSHISARPQSPGAESPTRARRSRPEIDAATRAAPIFVKMRLNRRPARLPRQRLPRLLFRLDPAAQHKEALTPNTSCPPRRLPEAARRKAP
jgi:hypothetical protein